jgi:hypothetical protein
VIPVELTAADRAVAEQIMRARIAARMTPEELGRAAHLGVNVVGLIEDATRPATPAEIAAVAGALGMAPAELMAGVPA